MKLVDNEGIIKNQLSKTLLYIGNEGAVTLEVILDQIKETMWVNQKTMAIFGVNVRTINEHIINIFKTNELDEISTIQKFWIVQNEGNRQIEREVKFYNLDVIISVGYRVNSKEGTQFRIWATKVLKEFLIKGFVLGYFFQTSFYAVIIKLGHLRFVEVK